MEINLSVEFSAILLSIISLFISMFAIRVSIRRYELQQKQHELQIKEFKDKYKTRFRINDEHFLTSHRLYPEQIEIYKDNPEQIEFQYSAELVNLSNTVLTIESLSIEVDAVDVEEMWVGCGDRVLTETFLAPHEKLTISHLFNKDNLDGFRRMIRNFSEKIGVLEFSVVCRFKSEFNELNEHKRILYRLTESGGDVSKQGYNPGKGHEKRNFLY